MRRVLITGITGYIGAHLARSLLADCEVYGLVREPIRTEYIEDIQDKLCLAPVDGSYESIDTALKSIRPELVYHLAAFYTGAHGIDVTPALIHSNIVFGAYLLEAMASGACTALVYASTIMTHYKEEPYRPLNLYAATKQALSDLIAYYTDCGLLRAVTLVLSDTYGSGDRRPKVLNLILEAMRTGETIHLSDGGQDYDVVHIDDVVRAFRMAGEQLLQQQAWKNERFQVCAANPLTLRQTVDKMLPKDETIENVVWGRRPAPKREIRQAVRVYPRLPGWSPLVPLEEGLEGLRHGLDTRIT